MLTDGTICASMGPMQGVPTEPFPCTRPSVGVSLIQGGRIRICAMQDRVPRGCAQFVATGSGTNHMHEP